MCVDAWARAGSDGSFRAVVPAAESGSGLLLRGERVGSEMFLTMRTLRMARS